MTQAPLAWLLLGPKAGDNAQMCALGDALAERHGWRIERRQLAFNALELPANLLLRVTLAGLDTGRCDPLTPPWPDVLISAGRRNEPVARWIRRASAGATRLVHVGRPWTHPDAFHLVISTPQYMLEAGGHVIVNDLPLHAPTDPGATPAFARPELPRPWLALLVGGHSGTVVMSEGDGARLAEAALSAQRSIGGSLLVTPSPRTPEAVTAALRAKLAASGVPHHLHDFAQTADNPYRAWLQQADAFMVTSDSMSMLAESAASNAPLWVVPAAVDAAPWWQTAAGWRFRSLTHRLGQWIGPRRLRRDTARMVAHLVDQGRAAWWPEDAERAQQRLQAPRAPQAADTALADSAARVAALLTDPRDGVQAAGNGSGG